MKIGVVIKDPGSSIYYEIRKALDGGKPLALRRTGRCCCVCGEIIKGQAIWFNGFRHCELCAEDL